MRSLAVTTGSADGIGPLVVSKALRFFNAPVLVTVYGTVSAPGELPSTVSWNDFSGRSSAWDAFQAACAAIQSGKHHALVTGPMAKKDFAKRNIESAQTNPNHLLGHTEVLAQTFHAETCMSFLNWQYRVALVTQHIPLRSVPGTLSTESIVQKGRIFGSFLRRHTGKKRVCLGVCGLNPHAATDLFPDSEDQRVVIPACEQLRAQGFEVVGPVSPDSAFMRYRAEHWDGLITLYHEQGLSFLKGLSFRDTVNVTLGLPFIRTSVDHGTAPGLNERDVDETNMLRALEWAVNLMDMSKETSHV